MTTGSIQAQGETTRLMNMNRMMRAFGPGGERGANAAADPFQALLSSDLLGNAGAALAAGQADGQAARGGAGADRVDLSGDKAVTLQYARAQFEINYQALRAVSGANGTSIQEVSFSFQGSFEFLQMASGNEATDLAQAVENGEGPFALLREMFTPEKTAERILDFALGFFPMSEAHQEGGDTPDARQSFADMIGDAIQKGFDEALGTLGKLPDPVQEEVDQTHDIVFAGLDDFVENGLDPEKTGAGGVYERIHEYRHEFSLQIRQRSVQLLSERIYAEENDDAAAETSSDALAPSLEVDA